ncbi:PorV/PorQ family protein [candidate division KSB1 bacterium]|nr:PorV/PorQ family protein [candidate division KSB1 bacterium]
MNVRFFYRVLVWGLLIGSQSGQGAGIAKYAGEFMATGVGARALGMGGAAVAGQGDVTYGYWNPAGLSSVLYPEIAAMHSRRFGGVINYDYLGVTLPFLRNKTLGLSLIRLGIDDIYYTELVRPGEPLSIDNRPYINRTVSDAEYAFYLSYASPISEKLSWGGNVKFIRKGVGDHSAWGIGFDVGVLWNPAGRLLAGVNLQDATTTVLAWNTGTTELISPTLKWGAGLPVQVPLFGSEVWLAADIDTRFEGRKIASQAHVAPVSFDFHLGAELLIKNVVALRLGNDVGHLTAGAGIRLPRLDVDYAFLSHDHLDSTHRISVRLRLEEERFGRR